MGYEPLDDFLRIGLQDPAATPIDHPEPEVLLAFQAAELPGPARERVDRHIAACRTCRQCVEDLAAIPDLVSEDAPRSEGELQADWTDLMERLRRGGESVPESAVGRPPRTPRHENQRGRWRAFLDFRLPLPLVAGLAAAAVGLFAWQHRSVPTTHGNVVVGDLGNTRARGAHGRRWASITVPPEAERVLLLVPLLDEPVVTQPAPRASRGPYRVEITPADQPERVRLLQPGLVPDAEDMLTVDMPADLLAAGRYLARVFSEGRSEPQIERPFEIVLEVKPG